MDILVILVILALVAGGIVFWTRRGRGSGPAGGGGSRGGRDRGGDDRFDGGRIR